MASGAGSRLANASKRMAAYVHDPALSTSGAKGVATACPRYADDGALKKVFYSAQQMRLISHKANPSPGQTSRFPSNEKTPSAHVSQKVRQDQRLSKLARSISAGQSSEQIQASNQKENVSHSGVSGTRLDRRARRRAARSTAATSKISFAAEKKTRELEGMVESLEIAKDVPIPSFMRQTNSDSPPQSEIDQRTELQQEEQLMRQLETQRASWSWYTPTPTKRGRSKKPLSKNEENIDEGQDEERDEKAQSMNQTNVARDIDSFEDRGFDLANEAASTSKKYLWNDDLTAKADGKKSDEGDVRTAKSEGDDGKKEEDIVSYKAQKPSFRSDRAAETTLVQGEQIAARRKVVACQEGEASGCDFDTIRYTLSSNIPQVGSAEYDEWQKTTQWSTTIGGVLKSSDVNITNVEPLRTMEVPQLAHGIDRVLFNPGVHWMRDPRSGIYNFDPSIRNLYDVDLFDYSALPPYQTSSVDEELAALTKKHKKRYSGSTSSLTALLSQIYFCISAWKSPALTDFTEGFQKMQKGFSFSAKLPANVVLRRFESQADEVGDEATVHYAVDSDKAVTKEVSNANYVLTQLGKSVEKLLTSSTEEYERYLRVNSHQLSNEEKTKKEAYHYAATDKFMLRSQLDCTDDRLPRRTFDLKTRAVVAVRADRANWVESSGYTLRHGTGVNESFERELWDMTRGTLLKYFFQARIGDMDGILVAYHSTSTVFGFQYFSREDIAKRLFGSVEMGEQAFRLCIGMLEKIFDACTSYFPKDTLRITMDAHASQQRRNPPLNVFVRPVRDGAYDEAVPDEQGRSCLLLELAVDRYLSDALVEGPVDFHVPKGYAINAINEDELHRRERKKLPSLMWSLEYSIKPASELDQTATMERLNNVLSRQAALVPMLMPNVKVLNERERMRQEALLTNPEAWKKFLEDRKTGVAAGMPIAPGQITFNDDDERIDGETIGTTPRKATEELWSTLVGSTESAQSTIEDDQGKSSARMVLGESSPTGVANADAEQQQDAIEQDEGTAEAEDQSTTEQDNDAPLRAAPPHISRPQVQWTPLTAKVQRLRRLAQLGQQDKDELAKTDRLEMYERRGD